MKEYEHHCIRCCTTIMYSCSRARLCPYCGEPMSKVFEQDLKWDSHPETEN